MRDKDAVSAETTRLQRNVDKQNKLVERLVDAEKNLTAQLVLNAFMVQNTINESCQSNLERELVAVKTASVVYKEKVETLNGSVAQWTRRCEAEQHRANEASVDVSCRHYIPNLLIKVHNTFRELEKSHSVKRAELRKMEDGLIRIRKELETKIKQQETTASQSSNSEHTQLLVR